MKQNFLYISATFITVVHEQRRSLIPKLAALKTGIPAFHILPVHTSISAVQTAQKV